MIADFSWISDFTHYLPAWLVTLFLVSVTPSLVVILVLALQSRWRRAKTRQVQIKASEPGP